MKKLFLLLAALLPLLAAGPFTGRAQPPLHPALENPVGIDAGDLSPAPGAGRVVRHRLYPLGFSRRGLFAYLAFATDADRRPTVYLRILDLVSDLQVLRKEFDVPDEPADQAVGELIAARGQQLSEILRKYEIVAAEAGGLRRFPLIRGQDELRASIRRRPAAGRLPRDCGGHAAEVVEVRLESARRGAKVIASYDTCFSSTPDIQAVAGYLKSPLEERIVVLAAGTQYRPPGQWDVRLLPIGAHLEAGFE